MSAEVPPDWFLEPLHALQDAAVEHALVAPVFTVTCAAEFGLRIGLSPGTSVKIMTPGGPITVRSEEKR